MSKIALKSSSSGTATFTIESPATNTDRTLNLPDSAGTVATAESTLAQFNVTGSAPVFACRAFVNFNGTGTVAIRASGNVSSITDNGPARYTVNFATAMEDANYSVSGTGSMDGGTSATATFLVTDNVNYSASSFEIKSVDLNAGFIDEARVNVAIFR